MHTRRNFLRLLGSAAIAGSLPAYANVGSRRVIVLGAGLSGLYSARLLEQLGFDVLVLEARQRVGGRIYTLDDVAGHPEGGGITIGPNYGRIISTAEQLGVGLHTPARGGPLGLMINGEPLARTEWADSPLNTLPGPLHDITPDRLSRALLRDNPLPASTSWRQPAADEFDISVAEFFRSKGLDDTALQWVDVNNGYGNRLEDTSLLSLYRVGASTGRAIGMKLPTLQVDGGNLRLPEAMAASLGQAVIFGELAVAVQQSGDGVRVLCQSGAEYAGDALICALPATAVRKLRFEPGLPEANWQAFQEVDYHKVTQAHLLADSPFWKEAGTPASWWTNGPLGRIFTREQANEAGSFNITIWINGDGCDQFDVMSEEEASAAILSELHQRVPASKGRVSMGKLVRWANDPMNEGTWAIWRPGESGRLPALLSQPHDQVFFAGEHTSISNSGMEGAMESADRVVLETLRRLT